MTPSSFAGVVTAIATVITSIGGAVLAVSVLIPILRVSRENKKAISEVHTIVNQQRTDAQRYQVALIAALKKAGVEVPIDQSQPLLEGDQTSPEASPLGTAVIEALQRSQIEIPPADTK